MLRMKERKATSTSSRNTSMSTSKRNFWISTNGLAAIELIAAAPDESGTQASIWAVETTDRVILLTSGADISVPLSS